MAASFFVSHNTYMAIFRNRVAVFTHVETLGSKAIWDLQVRLEGGGYSRVIGKCRFACDAGYMAHISFGLPIFLEQDSWKSFFQHGPLDDVFGKIDARKFGGERVRRAT